MKPGRPEAGGINYRRDKHPQLNQEFTLRQAQGLRENEDNHLALLLEIGHLRTRVAVKLPTADFNL